MDISTNESTSYLFPGYKIESTKPSIITLLKNGSSIIFYTALMIVIITSMYLPGSPTPVKIVSSILFVTGIILLYGYYKIYKATEKLVRESEEIYCSMLTCYLMERIEHVINNPKSSYDFVSFFEKDHHSIKTEIKNNSNTLISVFGVNLRNHLKNIFISENKEDKMKFLKNVSSVISNDLSMSMSSNSLIIYNLTLDIFKEFANETYDDSWLGFYRASESNLEIKANLFIIFKNGRSSRTRLETLENA